MSKSGITRMQFGTRHYVPRPINGDALARMPYTQFRETFGATPEESGLRRGGAMVWASLSGFAIFTLISGASFYGL